MGNIGSATGLLQILMVTVGAYYGEISSVVAPIPDETIHPWPHQRRSLSDSKSKKKQ